MSRPREARMSGLVPAEACGAGQIPSLPSYPVGHALACPFSMPPTPWRRVFPCENTGMEKPLASGPAELFARIRRMRERFDALSAKVAEDWADVPEDEGMAEIDAAVALERRR